MAWQDVARQSLGAEADGVIQALSSVNPNYDWSKAILQNAAGGQGQDGWFDPSRDAPASIAWGTANIAAQLDPANASWLTQAANGNLDAARQQQVSQIQQEQGSHGGGGLFGGGMGSLLGLGLGAAGLYFGIPGLSEALGAAGGLTEGAAWGAGLGAGSSDLAAMQGAVGLGGSATAGASAAATGANMFDLGGGLSLDEFGNVTGGLFPTTGAGSSAFDLGGGLSVDASGNITGGLFQGGPGTAGAGDFFSGGASGLNFGNFKDILSGASSLNSLFNGGGSNPLAGILKSLGIDPSGGVGSALNLAARTAPGLAALSYANSQPGIDTSGVQGILDKLGGNQDAVVKAATDPLQMNIAAGYGDLVQSQGLRGIRGSSFGDTDIANYISTTGRSLANAGANAAEGSLALQGNLAGNIAQLKQAAQTAKNNLFGKAFDIMGRGLNPTPTFNMTGMA